MQTMVPLYGFGGGGGSGATLTVTAPAGATVTVSKDGKTKTKTAGADGTAVFKGLATGQWTVTITDGEQAAQKTVTITADYSTAITFFAATIHVTYPAGSTCTATDGVTTLTAPDTSGTWDCVVPNAGTWTVVCGSIRKSEQLSNGDTIDVDLCHVDLFSNGLDFTDVTGGWSSSGWQMPGALCGDVYISGNNIICSGVNGSTYSGGGSVNKIDVSGYKKLTIYATGNSNNSRVPCKLGLFSNKNYTSNVATYNITTTGSINATIDISGVDGEYYIGFLVVKEVSKVVLEC